MIGLFVLAWECMENQGLLVENTPAGACIGWDQGRKQLEFSEYEQSRVRKRIRRAQILAMMKALLSWPGVIGLI